MDNTEIFLDKYKELEMQRSMNSNFRRMVRRLPSWKNGVNSRISGLN